MKSFRNEEERRQAISELAQANQDAPAVVIMDKLDAHIGAPPEAVVERLCACGGKYPITTFPFVNTGVVPMALLNLCKNCLDGGAEKGMVHFCCTSCKEVFLHAPPHSVYGGFHYKPGQYYHTSSCPHCSKASSAPCLELILFYKKNKIPYISSRPPEEGERTIIT